MKFSLIVILILNFQILFAQIITGIVSDSIDNQPISSAVVYNKANDKFAITDDQGAYSIVAIRGQNTLSVSSLGFAEKTISVFALKDTILNIQLGEGVIDLNEVVLTGKSVNLGRLFIKKVIKAKRTRKVPTKYSRSRYLNLTMEKNDTLHVLDEIKDTSKLVYLKESISEEYVVNKKFKRIVQQQQESNNAKGLFTYTTMGIDGRHYKGGNIYHKHNRYDFFHYKREKFIDIYDNYFTDKSISARPITSPLSELGTLSYNYKLKEIEVTGKDSLLTIQVYPKFRNESLWSGELVISTSDYHVRDVELFIDKGLLSDINRIDINYNYQKLENKWIIENLDLQYNVGTKDESYQVKYYLKYDNWDFDIDLKKNFFNNEIIRFETAAIEKDTLVMQQYRPIQLSMDQKAFINKQDSVYYALNDPEYLSQQDSLYNQMTWRSYFFTGIRHRYRSIGFDYTISPIAQLFRPFGIGGWRVLPGIGLNKEFLNATQLSVELGLDYGFRNKDVKGNVKVGYVFLPKKFAKIYGRLGDNYEFITVYQSFDALLARSNYVRNKSFSLGYAMEITNGIFMNTEILNFDKSSIKNLSRSPLLDSLFGQNNVPFDFERYKGFIWDTEITIKFNQNYVTRGPRKIILPSNSPILQFKYTKGIPNVLNSEVDFDYVEVSLLHYLPSTRLGSLHYQARLGSYITHKNLRFAEHKFFRGSTRWIFTNPIEDFQLLGPTLSTPDPFFESSMIHHFDGFFMDKIPYISRLQLELLGGAGILTIPSQDFLHLEAFVGLGKTFVFRKQTLQLALYWITSDSSQTAFNQEFKIGINFYDGFSRKWSY